jgi:hypothetical protein
MLGGLAENYKKLEMAEGAWVVFGTAIGTVGSIFTTWLAAHLSREKPGPLG